MTLALLINGESIANLTHAVSASERGLHYGDGVFETMLLTGGGVRFLDDHMLRLETGCQRLGIAAPSPNVLRNDIARVAARLQLAVIKVIVTRGASGRGYRPPESVAPTRIVAAYPAPEPGANEIIVNWRQTRLGRNARLAGIKHLNRLEQVLAQTEPRSGDFDEGLMLDTEGEVVSATAGNVFIVRDGALCTPDLRFCGVRGVMRAQVLRTAGGLGHTVSEEPLWPHDVEQASEVFITNSVRGVRSVAALGDRRWAPGAVAQRLREALQL
jgi:4-amino-4-deoxychorismate lyase